MKLKTGGEKMRRNSMQKKKNCMIRINSEILQQAKQQGYNISKVCENALKQKITTKQAFLNECSFAKENSMEPRAGFDPATNSLQGCRSTGLSHRGM